jgi:hypothetical protein
LRSNTAAALAKHARWPSLVACLALVAFALGFLEGSLQPWSSEKIHVFAGSATDRLAREADQTLTPAMALEWRLNEAGHEQPRYVVEMLDGNPDQPRPAAWSGDMRAFLRRTHFWLHGTTPPNAPNASVTIDLWPNTDLTPGNRERATPCPEASSAERCRLVIESAEPLSRGEPSLPRGVHHPARSVVLAVPAQASRALLAPD